LNPKQRAGVVLPLGILQVLLVGKKGRTLGEEHAEGGQSKILQVVAGVFALTIVGKLTNRLLEVA
jgi:hypothetical protein